MLSVVTAGFGGAAAPESALDLGVTGTGMAGVAGSGPVASVTVASITVVITTDGAATSVAVVVAPLVFGALWLVVRLFAIAGTTIVDEAVAEAAPCAVASEGTGIVLAVNVALASDALLPLATSIVAAPAPALPLSVPTATACMGGVASGAATGNGAVPKDAATTEAGSPLGLGGTTDGEVAG